MLTRKDYMADSANLHDAYYLEIANACGVKFTDPATIERFRKALLDDEHMNNIPLGWWDNRVISLKRSLNVRQVLKDRGDFYSMAGGVCILKAAARAAVKGEG